MKLTLTKINYTFLIDKNALGIHTYTHTYNYTKFSRVSTSMRSSLNKLSSANR